MPRPFLYGVRMLIPNYEHRPVKIGFSTNTQLRAASYFGGGPYPCEWMGEWPAKGGVKAEREAHERFAEYRLAGEWFFPAPEVVAFIKESVRLYLELLARKEAVYADTVRRARTRKDWWIELSRAEAYADFDARYVGVEFRATTCQKCRGGAIAAKLGVQLPPLDTIRSRIAEHAAAYPHAILEESAAAEMLGVPVTDMKRWRYAGLLTYSRFSSRRTFYYHSTHLTKFLDEVERLAE